MVALSSRPSPCTTWLLAKHLLLWRKSLASVHPRLPDCCQVCLTQSARHCQPILTASSSSPQPRRRSSRAEESSNGWTVDHISRDHPILPVKNSRATATGGERCSAPRFRAKLDDVVGIPLTFSPYRQRRFRNVIKIVMTTVFI